MKKLKIFNSIMSIVTPILLVTVVVLIISFGWYTKKQQVATIDATSKNVSVEYYFDDSEDKNVYTYQVENLVFFDDNSTFELPYLADMAVEFKVYLKNKGLTPINYSIEFKSQKIVKTVSSTTTSISYIDCLYKIDDFDSSVDTIRKARNVAVDGVSYSTMTDSGNEYVVVKYDSSESTTYFTRSGSGTNESPYVYTKAKGSFNPNVTYYKIVEEYVAATSYDAQTNYYSKFYYVVKDNVTDENYANYYISDSNGGFITPSEYDAEATYYEKTTTETSSDEIRYELASNVTSGNYGNYYVVNASYVADTGLVEPEYRLTLTGHSLAPGEVKELAVTMYLFGVQEIASAKNSDFLYVEDANEQLVLNDSYKFDLTIQSIPIADVEITENESEEPTGGDSGDDTGDDNNSGDEPVNNEP